jgi:hypothetical protein
LHVEHEADGIALDTSLGKKHTNTASQVGAETPPTTRYSDPPANTTKEPSHADTLEKVEGEAQGKDDALDKFLKDVDQGPRGAKVVQLTTEGRDVVEGESSFDVRK